MQSGTAIAVITATLMGIGLALGAAMSESGPNRIDGFEQIVYGRHVEHGKLALLGDCPLEREIIIERTGKTRISWYVQNSHHHGCARAADFEADSAQNLDEWWDEPVIARTEITLNSTALQRLTKRLETLSWRVKWTSIDESGGNYSIDCDHVTFSFPNRNLGILKSSGKVASLSLYGRQEGDSPSCLTNERSNEAALDAAFAQFAPLLPEKYELRPEVASRLNREK